MFPFSVDKQILVSRAVSLQAAPPGLVQSAYPGFFRYPIRVRLPLLLRLSLMILVLLGSLVGCAGDEARSWTMQSLAGPLTFPARAPDGRRIEAGISVDGRRLNRGRMGYLSYCASCHGLNGDGRGHQAEGMIPPPRDLRLAVYKFAAVRSGELPNDRDLLRVIRQGLNETTMTGWQLPEEELWEITQFIKTFPQADGAASLWLETYKWGPRTGPPKPTGKPVRLADAPWAGRREQALREGRAQYHLGAQCSSCHPSYVTQAELHAMAAEQARKSKDSSAPAKPREHPFRPLVLPAADNPFGIDLMPIDFTKDPLRSVRTNHELADLALVIAAGVGGAMPTWIDTMKNEQIWAMAYYVQQLCSLRLEANAAARDALLTKLQSGGT